MSHLRLTLPEGTITLRRYIPSISEQEKEKNFMIVARAKEEVDETRAGQKIMHWTRHVVADNKLTYPEPGKKEPTEEELEDVYIKISRHPKQRERLENEALFYANELRSLQGTVVPEFYGLYVGEGPNGQEMSCMVLEKVDGKGPCLRGEMARLSVFYACKIHRAGVIHGQLYSKNHIVPSVDDKIRIVDFTDAKLHECNMPFPTVALEDKTSHCRPTGCNELETMETEYCQASHSTAVLRPL